MREPRTNVTPNSAPQIALDELARLAAVFCGAPISWIGFMDADHYWFKSKIALEGGALQGIDGISRENSICAHTLLKKDVLVVEDTRADIRFRLLPLVAGEPKLRFYAGIPLWSAGGHAIGTLCVADYKPLTLSHEGGRALRMISSSVSRLIEENHTPQISFSEMAGGIAHEIKNPLSVIAAHAYVVSDLARENRLSHSHAIHAMDIITTVVTRINRIVQGMLSSAHAGKTESTLLVSIHGLVNDVLSYCQGRMEKEKIDFSFETPLNLRVACQPVRISQALLNLIGNAIDAVRNEPTRWIRLEVGRSETYIRFSVSDSGRGIDPAIREKLFAPLVTTKTVGEGNGLGLSISKMIVEAHGGRLYLDEGAPHTRFVFELPVTSQS
jgi:signal transduction histidine kinase